MPEISENMRKQIEVKGYVFEEVEMIEFRGKFDTDLLGSYCEALFRTKDGAYFICGEGTTSSPYQKRAGLLITNGTKLRELTSEEAQKWLDNPVTYPGL